MVDNPAMNVGIVAGPVLSLKAENTKEAEIKLAPAGGVADLTPTTTVQIAKIEGGEMYEGPYSCTPQNYAQTFKTAEKYMAADFLVRTVPVREAINTSGGITFAIGGN